MGFAYETVVTNGREYRRLCCDSCGLSGGVRKIRCPFGGCPPVARCANCRKHYASQHTKAHHRKMSCDGIFSESQKREARATYLLFQGKFVRVSALNSGPDQVHVLFRSQAGEAKGFYVTKSAYDAIPLLEPATPEDYEKLCTLVPAPDDFVR